MYGNKKEDGCQGWLNSVVYTSNEELTNKLHRDTPVLYLCCNRRFDVVGTLAP